MEERYDWLKVSQLRKKIIALRKELWVTREAKKRQKLKLKMKLLEIKIAIEELKR